MNESQQPFTDHVTKARSAYSTSSLGWVAAVFMTVLAVVFFLLWHSARTNREELESLKAKLDGANASLLSAQAENQTHQDKIAELKSQVTELEQEKQQVGKMAKGLEDEMRAKLESKDVTISQLQGKLTVNILDRVMFDSGEAILKPGGEGVMRKIGNLLTEHPEIKIHVIGHTDNVPIRPEAHGRFASNWELSTARALAALHFLIEKMGVDPRRVGAVGYGEYRPIADNSTPEGRAKNRRIAIAILPDELIVADAAGVKSEPATNSPPDAASQDTSALPPTR